MALESLGMERPDKFRVSRVGGFADVELISDGTSFTIHDRGEKRFAQIPVTGSLDQVVGRLRSEFHVDLPGADLLSPRGYEEIVAGVIEFEAHRSGRRRRPRVRALGIPQRRYGLADLD